MAFTIGEIFTLLRIPAIAIIIIYLILNAVYYLWYIYVVYTGRDSSCKAPLPPGTMGWPIIGESLRFITQASTFSSERFRKYKTRLFKTHIFGRPTIRIHGSENLHRVFHGENTIVESNWPESTRVLLGDVLTLSKGERHTSMRRHVSRAFTHEALEGYVNLALPVIQEAVDNWCTEDSVLAFEANRKLFFEITAVVLCGFDRSELASGQMSKTFMEFLEGFFTLPFDLPGTPYRKAKLAKKKLLAEFDVVLQRKLKLSSAEDTRDALRILMDNDQHLGIPTEGGDDASLENEMIDLFQAGFNTVSSGATTMVYHVSRNEGVLRNVRRELAENGLLSRENGLTFDRLCDCKYLTNAVKETLRISPPVGGGFRRVLKTFELEGFQIPQGWTVLYSIRDTMNFSEMYTDRNLFDPARFEPGRQEDQKGGRYEYPVFGGGSRSCIGKEFAQLVLRILLVEIARTCDIEPLNEGPVEFKYLPIPYPVNGYPVRFRKVDPADLVGKGVDFS